MTEQYRKDSIIAKYLEHLDVHPITIAVAVSNENYRKSYQLIHENPNISQGGIFREDATNRRKRLKGAL